jgi:2-dehydropantoate 2-reductase
MKICVVGAGAIGGFVAGRLAKAGHSVSVVLRGKNLAAVSAQGGLRLMEQDGSEYLAPVFATDRIGEVGPQDLVVLAVKSHQVADVAADLPALFNNTTRVITMQNGIPWWFFQGMQGFENVSLKSVDPTGVSSRYIDSWRIIGSIVYPAAEVVTPGVVKVIEGNRFSLGEPGQRSDGLSEISKLFIAAGFKAPIARDIRSEIMVKVWGNMSFNPISALTHATLEDICLHSGARALVAGIMEEGLAICDKLGIRLGVGIDQRIAGAQSIGQHKTSMLQDVEAGRRLELDALVAAMIELGEITQVPTPKLQSVYVLSDLLAKTLTHVNGRLSVQPL